MISKYNIDWDGKQLIIHTKNRLIIHTHSLC